MKIRQEINILNHTMGASETSSERCRVNSTVYSGTVTAYFECVAAHGGSSGTVKLQRAGTSTVDCTLTVTSSTSAHYKSSYTMRLGSTDYEVVTDSNISECTVARVVVVQDIGTDPLTWTRTFVDIGDYETSLYSMTDSPLLQPKYWYYDSSVWDGSPTFWIDIVWKVVSDKYAVTFKLQEDDGSFGSWSDKITIVSSGVSTSVTYSSSSTFTPTSGRNYRITVTTVGTKEAYSADIYCARVVINSNNESGITKIEPHYHLLNTGSTSTGLQNMDGYFDPAEWTDATLTCYAEHNASSSSSNTKLQQDPNGTPADISNSSITGTNRVRGGTALTMPGTAKGIDTYIVTA